MIQINAKDSFKLLSILKLELNSILNLFDQKSRIFYIDYPVYTNVGDLLINLGTEKFFLEHNIKIYQRYSILDIPSATNLKVDDNTTFLCQGGGNFGDLYVKHQNLREWITENFPQARIICLPQSLHYSSHDAQCKSLEKFAKHPNCHILVRDQESLDLLHTFNVSASMMPDMAHQLWGDFDSIPSSKSGIDMYFLRQDKEAAILPEELNPLSISNAVDWDSITSIKNKIFVGIVYYFLLICGRFFPQNLNVSIWYFVRNLLIRDALKYFSGYGTIYTNRLHAMILGLLLGHDIIVFDNSYGKLGRYIESWLSSSVRTKYMIIDNET